MKKCLMKLFIAGIITGFTLFGFGSVSSVNAANGSYTIDIAGTDCSYTQYQTYSTYAAAYQTFVSMTDQNAVIRNPDNKVVAMKQGMVVINSYNSTLTFISTFANGTQAYCTNNVVCYYNGTDATGTVVTLTLSGYTGTCYVDEVILIPAAFTYGRNTSSYPRQYEFDYYARDGANMEHYLSYYDASVPNTYFYSITVDKAPSFMQEGVRYYSTDGYTYYTDPIDAVNKTNPIGTHCIYFKMLSYRSETSYTVNELNQYLSYRNNTYWTERTSAYLNLGSTFLEGQTRYGVNAAMEIAFADLESAYGKSDFAIENYNFFGVGAFDSDPSQAEVYSGAQNGIIQHAKWMSRNYFDAYFYIDTSLGYNYYDVSDRDSGWAQYYTGDSRYFGTNPGNKYTGVNVKYASDPWHGEKVANRMFEIDSQLGYKDYGKYTLAVTNTAAYAYSQPSTSSFALYKYSSKDPNRAAGSYSNTPVGMSVVIIGESGDFYKILSEVPVNSAGRSNNSWDYDHTTSVAYILKSNVNIIYQAGTIPSEEQTSTSVTNSTYKMDAANKLVRNIEISQTVGAFKTTFANGSVKIFSGSTELSDSTVMASGMIIKFYENDGSYSTSYMASVRGDTNGDGAITISDLVCLRRHLAGLDILEAPYQYGGDINSSNDVTISDIVVLRRFLAGLQSM